MKRTVNLALLAFIVLLLLGLYGLYYCVVNPYFMRQAVGAWDTVPFQIVEWNQVPEGDAYYGTFAYHYEGRDYVSSQVSFILEHADRLMEIGEHTLCLVNPETPQQAVLFPDETVSWLLVGFIGVWIVIFLYGTVHYALIRFNVIRARNTSSKLHRLYYRDMQ